MSQPAPNGCWGWFHQISKGFPIETMSEQGPRWPLQVRASQMLEQEKDFCQPKRVPGYAPGSPNSQKNVPHGQSPHLGGHGGQFGASFGQPPSGLPCMLLHHPHRDDCGGEALGSTFEPKGLSLPNLSSRTSYWSSCQVEGTPQVGQDS